MHITNRRWVSSGLVVRSVCYGTTRKRQTLSRRVRTAGKVNLRDDSIGSEAFYRTLVENASEGMLTIDADSRIVYANPAIERILGYSPAELVGSSKMKIIPERLRPAHAAALQSYIETGEKNIDWNGIELPALHKDGHEVPTLISLREHEHDGERYFTGIVRDISERRNREKSLEEQNERLDEFADILSHDIRSPLSVARGYTELAHEKSDAPELEQALAALDRIDDLIDDILTYSREGGFVDEAEPFRLDDAVRAEWSLTAAEDADLRVEDIGRIEANESRVRELLGNLFRNAVTHGGPDVTVRVGSLPDGFYVEDDGPGIPAADRETVFEYGYTTREGGSGYGLSIVKQIANEHGWNVRVVEGSDGGARFEFTGVDPISRADR
ncbi:PAS domain S-box protein [Natronomonas sp. CBA1123]|nr:PAS domain-containing sensor histidine kinase [Natronomonas sp. CBA1123]MUV86487.1 PAS domain S-box protein [Natronomonas sp. CBA1123]